MDASGLFGDLPGKLGALFTCSKHGEYWQIETPFLYPDGDVIEVYCKVGGDTVTVTDLAETTGWLWLQSGTRRTAKHDRWIAETCQTHDLEFRHGMLQARCRPGDDLAAVVMRVAQGALRVSDISLMLRTRAGRLAAEGGRVIRSAEAGERG